MLDLDPYGGTDPLGMFPLFLKRTADVMAPITSAYYGLSDQHIMVETLHYGLSVVFRRLVRLGSVPACWRLANVTPIPKGAPSSTVPNYRQFH